MNLIQKQWLWLGVAVTLVMLTTAAAQVDYKQLMDYGISQSIKDEEMGRQNWIREQALKQAQAAAQLEAQREQVRILAAQRALLERQAAAAQNPRETAAAEQRTWTFSQDGEMRSPSGGNWSFKKGGRLDASFICLEGTNVIVLAVYGGTRRLIPVTSLCEDDCAYLLRANGISQSEAANIQQMAAGKNAEARRKLDADRTPVRQADHLAGVSTHGMSMPGLDGSRFYYGSDGSRVISLDGVGGSRLYYGSDGSRAMSLEGLGGSRLYYGSDGVRGMSVEGLGGSRFYQGSDGSRGKSFGGLGGSGFFDFSGPDH